MNRTLMLCAALFTATVTVGCDSPDDQGTEYRDQLADAEIALEDAVETLTAESEVVVVDVTFELGVDSGFYLIEAVLDDELVVYEVDARTGERVEAERGLARGDRADLARRHRHLRLRLAELVRELRAERRGDRAVRASLVGDDVEIELMDARGRRQVHRRRLAQ
jgi:hypothetical protein